MKIIKKGILPQDKIYRGTCMRCKTVIEATQTEGRLSLTDRTGVTMVEYTCPICSEIIWGWEHVPNREID